MSNYELAQLNIARMVAPIDSPQLTEFAAELDRINELAETSPGYVWRLQTDEGNATAIRDFGEEYLVNLSVWKDIESLYQYAYRTAHAEILAQRKEWFEKMEAPYAVLWWVEAGRYPTTADAKKKLERLRISGPSAAAFTFKRRFPPPA